MDKINIRTDKRANQKIKLTGSCRLFTFALAVLLLSGCVKDDLYNTPHPDKGAVTVTTDWTERSSDATLPENYILRIGDKEQTVSGETNAFDALFLPGSQDLLVYHSAEGITISGTTATVNTLADGRLETLPDYLFSGAATLAIPADDTLKVTVPMKQRIRSLTLTLKLQPGDETRIGSTSSTLTGIMPAIDLATGTVAATEGKTVSPAFALGTDNGTRQRAAGHPVLTAHLRLLGIMTGEKQLLNLVITLTDGYVQRIETDLTEALKNFGTGNMEPLALDATLELPTAAGVTATISDWTTVDNGNIDIH